MGVYEKTREGDTRGQTGRKRSKRTGSTNNKDLISKLICLFIVHLKKRKISGMTFGLILQATGVKGFANQCIMIGSVHAPKPSRFSRLALQMLSGMNKSCISPRAKGLKAPDAGFTKCGGGGVLQDSAYSDC